MSEHPEHAEYRKLARDMEFHESKQFEADDQKVALVDIDETVCAYGEKRRYDLAVPINKNIQKINDLYDKGWYIIYWTARGTVTKINWLNLIQKQLNKLGCRYHDVRVGKPQYDLWIDDKSKRIEEL